MPKKCPDVPRNLMDARSAWSDVEDYDRKARELAGRFEDNYQQYAAR